MDGQIKEDIQSPDAGASPEVSLYTLDLTGFGGAVHYLTPAPNGDSLVVFNGITYEALPIEVKGMKWTGDGKFPRPTVSISNISLALHAQVVSMGDMVAGLFTRNRTFKKYLDGEPEANSTALFPPDIYEINRKLKHNKQFLQFELKSPLDMEGQYLPRRQILPFCQHTYRSWDGSSFDYTGVTCPYTDIDCYDDTGAVVTAASDKCGKTRYDCSLRFPSTNNSDNQLPMKDAVPGVGRFGRSYRK